MVYIILKAVNTSNPIIGYPVGRAAGSVLKARRVLLNNDLEEWARESYMKKRV